MASISSKLFILAFIVLVLLATSKTEAQPVPVPGGGVVGSVVINGTVFCTVNGSVIGTATTVFANAMVQLQCGSPGAVVNATTTNSAGMFSMALTNTPLASLVANCRLVVTTPLSACNAGLPSTGFLQSAMKLVGITLQGIIMVGPTGFMFLSNI